MVLMGWLKNIRTSLKLKHDIEKLQLKNQKMKLKNAITSQKVVKTNKEISNFIKTAQNIQEMREVIDNKGPIIQFLETQTGQQLAQALIMKFGGGSGSEAAGKVGELLANLTPEQKAKGLRMLNEFLQNQGE